MTSKIAIFASGNGTNFTALVEAIKEHDWPVDVGLMVCDHAKAPVIQRATKLGIPVLILNYRHFHDKATAEMFIQRQLIAAQIEWIFLAGFMRIIGPTLLGAFPKHIINIHPALLPSFPGRNGIEDAYEAGVTETGITIHYVDAGIDTGQIITQKVVQRYPDDTLEQLAQRIHTAEHAVYPMVLKQLLIKGQIK